MFATPLIFIVEPLIVVVALVFPKDTGNDVVPFVAQQSIPAAPPPILSLKIGLVVFWVNNRLSPIHNCLLPVLLTPHKKAIPPDTIEVFVKNSWPLKIILGVNVEYNSNVELGCWI